MSAASQRERKKKAAKKRADNAATKPRASAKKAAKTPRPELRPGLYEVIESDRMDLMMEHLKKQPHEDVDHILNWQAQGMIIPMGRIDAASFLDNVESAQAKHDKDAQPKKKAADDPPAS